MMKMLISEIPDAKKICTIAYSEKKYRGKKIPYFPHTLKGIWEVPNIYERKGFVYFITFNDIIVKIGQSSNLKGYAGLVGSYLRAGMGDTPGEGRFVSAYQIREALENDIVVSFHSIEVKDIQYTLCCPFTGVVNTQTAPPNMQIYEKFYIDKYMEKESVAPMMNYTNNNESHGYKYSEAFREYHKINSLRKIKK